MNDYLPQSEQMTEANGMFYMFMLLAAGLVIYYGFKKSTGMGILAVISVVIGVYLFFTVPTVESFIIVAFAIYFVIGLVGLIWEKMTV